MYYFEICCNLSKQMWKKKIYFITRQDNCFLDCILSYHAKDSIYFVIRLILLLQCCNFSRIKQWGISSCHWKRYDSLYYWWPGAGSQLHLLRRGLHAHGSQSYVGPCVPAHTRGWWGIHPGKLLNNITLPTVNTKPEKTNVRLRWTNKGETVLFLVFKQTESSEDACFTEYFNCSEWVFETMCLCS